MATAQRVFAPFGDDAPDEYEDAASELAEGVDRAVDGQLTVEEVEMLVA